MQLLKCTHRSEEDSPTIRFTLEKISESDEITQEDLKNGHIERKKGYQKLQFCANQAKKDGFYYIWIDTCCIDKQSSADVSEAIQLMFQWYKNAVKCYVYLIDVSFAEQSPSVHTQGWNTAFQKSEWFERCWTLQELLAPKSVEFFSIEGTRLGDKESLGQDIHQITGIPVTALSGTPLTQFPQNDRFEWAEHRKATKPEDAAYCLLGIFEVNIPLIYGEGKNSAMNRLREAIGEENPSTLSVMASPPWIVPFQRNKYFIGRSSELATFKEQLFSLNQTTSWAITGLGGVGKTQFLIEFLYRLKETCQDCMILWVSAATGESLYQGFSSIAKQLKIPGCTNKDNDPIQLTRGWLERVTTGRWVLVFDNADDIDLWTQASKVYQKQPIQASSPRLIDSLPQNERGSIIFTTRDMETAHKLAPFGLIHLSRMDETIAVDIFRKHLNRSDLTDDTNVTAKLLAELTYLPLAIVQAAAYINVKNCTLKEYLELLYAQEQEAIDLLSRNHDTEGRCYTKDPVATTWLISFQYIRQHHPLAAECLSFMACVHYKDIPLSLLPPRATQLEQQDAIGTLMAYSFVERQGADSTFYLHRLVHLAARSWLRKEKILNAWEAITYARLNEVFPSGDHQQQRDTWRRYLPHAEYLITSSRREGDIEQRLSLTKKSAKCLFQDGRWNKAEALLTQALEIHASTSGSDIYTLESTTLLAATYRNQGRRQEAEELELQLIKSSKSSLGTSHPDTFSKMNNLVLTYQSQERFDEAEQLQEQVVNAFKQQLGEKHPHTLTALANLASIYWGQERWNEAEKLFRLVSATQIRELGAGHLDTLRNMNNLALTHQSQGRFNAAEPLQEQVMKALKQQLSEDHPDTLAVMVNLALTYQRKEKFDEAEPLQVHVMQAFKQQLGEDHLDTLNIMVDLASTYQGQGAFDEAEPLQVRVIKAFKQQLGENHLDTLMAMAKLALTYQRQLRLNEAESLQVQVMKAFKQELGEDHPDTLMVMAKLAVTYQLQWRLQEASELGLPVIEAQKRKLGADHPETLASMRDLALIYRNRAGYNITSIGNGINLSLAVMLTFLAISILVVVGGYS